MLRGDDNAANAQRAPVIAVLDGNLAFAVRAQKTDFFVLAGFGETLGEFMVSAIGSGISPGVSSQAKPNINP